MLYYAYVVKIKWFDSFEKEMCIYFGAEEVFLHVQFWCSM